MNYISLNGQLLPTEDARIAPGDAGFLHGAGLFETMRARNGKIFRAADHLARLAASAQALGLDFSLPLSDLTQLVTDLLEANELTDARLRLTITRGDIHAITAENPTPPLTLLISASPFTPYPAALYEKGMTVIVSPCKQIPQNPLTGHKSTSYFERLLALRQAHAAGAGEALWFTPENLLAEACMSNVFIVDGDNILATPPLTLPPSLQPASLSTQASPHRLCLPGITRQITLQLAAASNLIAHERPLTINDLLSAKEIFLTNAIMGLMPVSQLEQHSVSGGKPGPATQQLRAAYESQFTTETA